MLLKNLNHDKFQKPKHVNNQQHHIGRNPQTINHGIPFD